mmetsp:Transcript_26194/g.30897  ORF Transcript_26194/g.30897 Transcript_26194/m.30897 type:complete len:308 (+) Transcript_26194:86-1009(+)
MVDKISQQWVGCEISIPSPCSTMSSSKNHNHHGRDINLKQENRCRSTSPSPSSAFNLICRMETLSQKWKGFKVSIPSPCFTTCSSKNHHGCSINLKQENRDHSTSASSALKTTISITESRGDATSATASVSTSSQTEKGGYARPISPTTVSTTHSRKEKDILDSMLSPSDWQRENPSDWQWKQGSMTSITSTIQTSISARLNPILWKISKRCKSSKILKELSPKGPSSPTLMKEGPPSYRPVQELQSQPQQLTLTTIESTTTPSPQKNDRSGVLLEKYSYELKRVQTKFVLLNNGVENYIKVVRVTT